jgi:hypothetical protein
VARVETMRNYLVGASLAHGVACELGTLLRRKDWLLPEQREGWSDRFRQSCTSPPTASSAWSPWSGSPGRPSPSTTTGAGAWWASTRARKRRSATLAEHDLELARPGQVPNLLPPEEDIHRMTNAGTGKAISIHVYGADIGKLGSGINHVFDDLPLRPEPGNARRVAWRA